MLFQTIVSKRCRVDAEQGEKCGIIYYLDLYFYNIKYS